MRQTTQHCAMYQKQMMWNLNNMCYVCEQENSEEVNESDGVRGQELNVNEDERLEEMQENNSARNDTTHQENSVIEGEVEERALDLGNRTDGAVANDAEVGQREPRRRMMPGNMEISG